jgi:hypothetical protein
VEVSATVMRVVDEVILSNIHAYLAILSIRPWLDNKLLNPPHAEHDIVTRANPLRFILGRGLFDFAIQVAAHQCHVRVLPTNSFGFSHCYNNDDWQIQYCFALRAEQLMMDSTMFLL